MTITRIRVFYLESKKGTGSIGICTLLFCHIMETLK